MKLKYIVYREGNQYVSQCLNVDIASCGDTIKEAVDNLKDALELYFRDEPMNKYDIPEIDEAILGEAIING